MNPGPELNRRALLGATGLAAAGLLLPTAPAVAAPALARAGRPVLTHGVQLGDPRTDGAVVWTRAGEVNVDGATGQLRVDLRDQAGRSLWARTLDPMR